MSNHRSLTDMVKTGIAKNAGRTVGPLLGRASLNARGDGASFSVNMIDPCADEETGKTDVPSFTAI